MLQILFFLSLLALTLAKLPTENLPSDTPLRIGIKHRPESCEKKTKNGDRIFMNYRGRLVDGKEFDNSYDRGKPLDFVLGSGQVIKGWDQGLVNMVSVWLY